MNTKIKLHEAKKKTGMWYPVYHHFTFPGVSYILYIYDTPGQTCISAFATAPLFHQHCNTCDRKKKKKRRGGGGGGGEKMKKKEKKKETDWTPRGNSNSFNIIVLSL